MFAIPDKSVRNDLRNLLECTEDNHAGCPLLPLPRFLLQEAVAEMEELRDVECEVRVKGRLVGFAALPILIVSVHVPVRAGSVEGIGNIVGNVRNDQLRPGDAVAFEVLEVVMI